MVMRVVTLSKLQLRNIFTAILKAPTPGPDDAVAPDSLFYILLADVLGRLEFLQPEQRLLIVEGVWAQRHTPRQDDAPCCMAQIAFADGRYCTWTGHTGWVDLESGETLAMLPAAPLESIAYNLDELYRRGVLQIEKKAGFHAKKFDARSVDEPGDVCQRAPDDVP